MKNKILIPLLIIGVLAAFFSFKYSARTGQSSDDRRKLVLQSVMKAIDAVHYSPRSLDDTFSSRVYHKLLTEFDYEKLFFTRQDIAVLHNYEFKIDDEIRDNSIEFFDTLDAIYIRRTGIAEKYYKDALEKPFTFTSNETIQLNPDKEEYAASENDLAQRWRERLKYRVLAKFVDLKTDQDKKKENKDSVNAKFKTDQELEVQARDDVRKSYERWFKQRIHKIKDDDRYTFFVNAITETEDPHTSYFPPVDKKIFDEGMSGSFVGIGARLSPANDKITVSEVIVGSPSWRQGELKAGDEIIKVAQDKLEPVDIAGFDIDDVVKLIRGPKDTKVNLTVKRTDGSTKVIAIVRGVVEIEETFAKSAIIKSKDGPIGYIFLPEFYADFNHTSGRTSSADVAAEVKKLKDAGVKGIIIDLRFNGGGSLGDVVDIAGLFIGKGPVVQVRGSHSAPSVLRAQVNDSALYNGPLAIMVGEGSASASEILAAALQDYKRAVIVGSVTYGKGTVQKMVELDQLIDPISRLNMLNDTDGAEGKSLGVLKLTMEKFYRVTGRSTQLKGVTPDISVPDQYDGYDDEELGERHNKSAMAWDEIPAASFKPTNSIANLQYVESMSKSRISNNPTFKLIQDNSEYFKKKKDDNVVSLNEVKYKKEQDEVNDRAKKMEDQQKKAVLLEMTNAPADMNRINADTSSISKNKEWLKNLSKDIYISETVNIVDDIAKSGMKVNMGTGMK